MLGNITIDPNLPYKKDLWVNVYKSVINGLYKNDKCLISKNYEAKQVADKAIKDYEEQFENGKNNSSD